MLWESNRDTLPYFHLFLCSFIITIGFLIHFKLNTVWKNVNKFINNRRTMKASKWLITITNNNPSNILYMHIVVKF